MMIIVADLRTVLATCLVIFLISVINSPKNPALDSQRPVTHSDVWCSGSDHNLKSCHFKNICYSKDYGFLFVLTNDSKISGVENYREFQHLKLAPIDNHSAIEMKISLVRDLQIFNTTYRNLSGQYFLLYRFKPDNFLHVLHDDILPLFVKFKEICFGNVTDCSSKYSLLFADPNEKGPFTGWYNALSANNPLSLQELNSQSIHCFSSLSTGAANISVFQYGFKRPQGPTPSMLRSSDVTDFRDYYLNHMRIAYAGPSNRCIITLISRNRNRKVLNEDYIFQTIGYLLDAHPEICSDRMYNKIDLLGNSTGEIFHAVASSNILISMHGAETFLALFLPNHSVFIELFPFGIFKENVSPIHSLSHIPQNHFVYLSWNNKYEQNSVAHPEYPKQFGGIEEFTDEMKRDILGTKNVSAVECCNNPHYLFRMYQDTIVDDTFKEIADKAVQIIKRSSLQQDIFSQWHFPAPVQSLSCVVHENRVDMFWSAPFNVARERVTYNLSLLYGSSHTNVLTDKLMYSHNFTSRISGKIQAWVFSVVHKMESADSHCDCDPLDQ